MKKYLHYNASQYSKPVSEVGARSHGLAAETTPRNESNELILDLSGKPGNNAVAMVTGQKWTNEQDAALDLSSYGKQSALSGQAEALDLSKPSTPWSQHTDGQSYSLSQHALHQSRRVSHTPPSSSHSRPGQYSLLQAALNSNQSNAALQPGYDQSSQSRSSTPESRARVFSGSLSMPDATRSIRPFSSVASTTSRPLGISVPHMALSNPSVAVVQGIHKPIAITTPQQHGLSVNTKNQRVDQTTVGTKNANQSSTNKGVNSMSQPEFRTNYHGKMMDQSGPDIHSAFMKQDDMVQRYVIRTPDGRSQVIGGQNYIQMEPIPGFPCAQCPKVFKTKAAMKLHTTVHKTAAERQYGCQICERRFLHHHHLIVHQRKHSGEKPFKCDACSKTFMAIFLLHKHLRKHVRENSPKSQISTDQLQQLHIKKMTSDKPKGHYGSARNVALPMIQDSDPVIVSDEEDSALDSLDIKSNNKIANIVHTDEANITYSPNEAKTVSNEPNLDLMKENMLNMTSVDVNGGKSSSLLLSIVGKTTDGDKTSAIEIQHRSKEIYNISDSFERVVQESQGDNLDTINTSFDSEINQFHVNSSNEMYNNDENEMKCEDEVKNEVKLQETKVHVTNPFPEYTSDDEVELNFETGELKVTNKQADNSEEGSEEKRGKAEEIHQSVNEEMFTKDGHKEIAEEDEEKRDEVEGGIENNNEKCSSRAKTENGENNILNGKVLCIESVSSEDENDAIVADETIGNKEDVFDKSENKIEFEKTDGTEMDNIEKLIKDIRKKLIKDNRNIETNNSAYAKENIQNHNEPPLDSVNKKQLPATLGIKQTEQSVFENTIEPEDPKMKQKLENVQKRKSSENTDIAKSKLLKLEDKEEAKLEEVNIPEQNGISDLLKSSNKSKCYDTEQSVDENKQTRRGKKRSKSAKCESCLKSFRSNHHLVLHMAVHKKNPMLQSLKKAKAYQMKALGFAGQTSFNCQICKKVFKFQKSLNSHMRIHSEKLQQRKLLSKAFRDFMAEATPFVQNVQSSDKSQTISNVESQLKNSHDGGKSLENTELTQEEEEQPMPLLLETMKIYKDENDPPVQFIIGMDKVKRYVCHACDNTYTTKQKLRMHALIHKDNCFLCDICGKSFFRQVTLDKHISTHMLPRPHVCNLCKKSFIHRSSLMRHKVVHEKPALPSLKQQVADVNFELKMLDTYTLLRQERMQMIQMEKMKELKIEPVTLEQKDDILDLSVRIKTEDTCLPPVLSPANMPTTSLCQSSPANLSPPLITHEYCDNNLNMTEHLDKIKTIKDETSSECEPCYETFQSVSENGTFAKRKKTRNLSDKHSGPINTDLDFHTFHKRSRKTRVYQTSCRVCKEKFPNVMLLKTHMTIHNTLETHLYECHVCNHRFTQSCSLLRHLKTSCQENQMKCLPCNKTFHRRNTYEQHMKLHNVGPPDLNGSFYDKRKDEAEIKEEVIERESDVENNNTKIEFNLSMMKTEVLGKSYLPARYSVIKEDSNDSTDSDARTYLYSEGEAHDNHLSDFSDTELSPPQSPKKEDMPRHKLNISPNAMTLNLLSAVCSDIRNAEKEEELLRIEQEERQKELETIEILANLKRGAIQSKTISEVQSTEPSLVPTGTLNKNHVHVPEPQVNIFDFVSRIGHEQGHKTHDFEACKSQSRVATSEQTKCRTDRGTLHNNKLNDCLIVDNPPAKYEPKNNSNLPMPQIPTVVLEISDDQERRRQNRLSAELQNRMIHEQSKKEETPAAEINTHNLLRELSHIHRHNPLIQDRLSLLMKAQIPSSSSSSSSPSTSSSQPRISDCKPVCSQPIPLLTTVPKATTSHRFTKTSMSTLVSSRIDKYINEGQNSPQDLSTKKRSTEKAPLHLTPRSSPSLKSLPTPSGSSLGPPPLIPVFHCELCGRLLYNQTDLHIHMREHGLSPNSASQHLVTVSPGDQGLHRRKEKKSTSTDIMGVSNSTPRPPATLDLSVKKSVHKSGLISLSQLGQDLQDSCSSLNSSDFSDTLPSPTTSTSSTTTANLDVLRQELRAKIYARRRSQGLEELTVEFKQPEPTEMTEEEKLKLNFRRECNRQAAQRSRMRKKDLVDTLLERLGEKRLYNDKGWKES